MMTTIQTKIFTTTETQYIYGNQELFWFFFLLYWIINVNYQLIHRKPSVPLQYINIQNITHIHTWLLDIFSVFQYFFSFYFLFLFFFCIVNLIIKLILLTTCSAFYLYMCMLNYLVNKINNKILLFCLIASVFNRNLHETLDNFFLYHFVILTIWW